MPKTEEGVFGKKKEPVILFDTVYIYVITGAHDGHSRNVDRAHKVRNLQAKHADNTISLVIGHVCRIELEDHASPFIGVLRDRRTGHGREW